MFVLFVRRHEIMFAGEWLSHHFKAISHATSELRGIVDRVVTHILFGVRPIESVSIQQRLGINNVSCHSILP